MGKRIRDCDVFVQFFAYKSHHPYKHIHTNRLLNYKTTRATQLEHAARLYTLSKLTSYMSGPRSGPPRCPASASALLAATLLLIARNTLLQQPAASSTHRPVSPPSSVDHPPAAATSMPAEAEDGVSVGDDEPLAFLWPEHLRRPRIQLTAAKDATEEQAAANPETDVAATVPVPVAVAVPVAVPVPVPVPEEKPPAPLSRMPWRPPPPPPSTPPPPSQPPQPLQPPQPPQPSKRGRGGRGRGGRGGRVGSGGGADGGGDGGGGGGGGGGGAASGGEAAGPVSFGFVLDARYRQGSEASWLLHHPSLPRPVGGHASAVNLAAWRAARRATLLGMHTDL